jgi:hypothetical protein
VTSHAFLVQALGFIDKNNPEKRKTIQKKELTSKKIKRKIIPKVSKS